MERLCSWSFSLLANPQRQEHREQIARAEYSEFFRPADTSFRLHQFYRFPICQQHRIPRDRLLLPVNDQLSKRLSRPADLLVIGEGQASGGLKDFVGMGEKQVPNIVVIRGLDRVVEHFCVILFRASGQSLLQNQIDLHAGQNQQHDICPHREVDQKAGDESDDHKNTDNVAELFSGHLCSSTFS